MNEHDIREMVRESIARHRGDTARLKPPLGVAQGGPEALEGPDTADSNTYATAAFVRLPLLRGGDDDGNCIIEPAVRCNHCGYCQSYGH